MPPSLQHLVHRLDNARYHGGARTSAILALVWHCTAGESALSSIGWLNRDDAPKGGKASYHYVIDHDGTIYRMTPVDVIAYHGGGSSWADLPRSRGSLNHCTIGIAFACKDRDTDVLTDAQLESARWLSVTLMRLYDIPPARNVGHREIAPTRKTDPNPCVLDMDAWRDELAALVMTAAA